MIFLVEMPNKSKNQEITHHSAHEIFLSTHLVNSHIHVLIFLFEGWERY